MATKKTTPTKRATPKKSTTTKKAPVKKATTVRTTTAPRKKTPAKNQAVRSFRVTKNPEDFMTFRINRQTIYWIIFGTAVIALALWVMSLQRDINDLYDQIDRTQAESQMLLPAEVEAIKKQKAREEAADKHAQSQ